MILLRNVTEMNLHLEKKKKQQRSKQSLKLKNNSLYSSKGSEVNCQMSYVTHVIYCNSNTLPNCRFDLSTIS